MSIKMYTGKREHWRKQQFSNNFQKEDTKLQTVPKAFSKKRAVCLDTVF